MCASKKDKQDIKKTHLIVGVIAIVIIVVLSIIWIGLWFFFNDLGFWTEVEIENKSNQEIWVTPIGHVEGVDEIGPLGRIYKTSPFDNPQNTEFHLKPNKSITIKYDWDDQNFQFILIENKTGCVLILLIDDHQYEPPSLIDRGGCCPPMNDSYSIPDLNQLEEAPGWLLPTIQGSFVTIPSDSP